MPFHHEQHHSLMPRMDIIDSADETQTTIEIDLAGCHKRDLSITVHDGKLEVSGAIHPPADMENGYAVVTERMFGSFRREVAVPVSLQVKDVRAVFEDHLGLLRITLPHRKSDLPVAKVKVQRGGALFLKD